MSSDPIHTLRSVIADLRKVETQLSTAKPKTSSHPDSVGPGARDGTLMYPLALILDRIEVTARNEEEKSYLRLMVLLENWDTGAFIEASVIGSYRGIAQFGESTWDWISTLNSKLTGVSWEEGTKSVSMSIVAALVLYRKNKVSFGKSFPRRYYSREIAYTYHQQGAGGGRHYIRTGTLKADSQSHLSKLVMSAGRSKMLGLPILSQNEELYPVPKWVS